MKTISLCFAYICSPIPIRCLNRTSITVNLIGSYYLSDYFGLLRKCYFSRTQEQEKAFSINAVFTV